jgi:hypothetical protein
MSKPPFLFAVLIIAFTSLACLSLSGSADVTSTEFQVFANQGWQSTELSTGLWRKYIDNWTLANFFAWV